MDETKLKGSATLDVDPQMLENLDMLLDMEVLENEKDWDLINQDGTELLDQGQAGGDDEA